MIFDDDVVTMREAAHNHEGGMIVFSKQVARRPKGETPVFALMSRPFTFTPPPGHEFCGECGDWRPRSYFALNPAHKRGIDYVCKGCKSILDRQRRVIAAAEQGRELREYRKRAA